MNTPQRRARLARLAACLALVSSLRAQPAAPRIEIIRDTFGVPHIFAGNFADAVFGQAYCHAEDNLPQLLENLAAARGEAAKSGGRARLESDFTVRVFNLREIARQAHAALPPEVRAVADAYAAGVNRHFADHPARRPAGLAAVLGVDVIAMGRLRQLQEAMGSAQGDFAGASQASRERGLADGDEARSNMWALAPRRTADGSTMLVSDPHLPWDGPTKWHEAHLVVGDRWLYGATFPGSPGAGIGFNPDLAWGMTNNGADLADVYRIALDPQNHNRYRYEGGWREISTRKLAVEVREADGAVRTMERVFRFTHHGPILREDAAAHTAFAARLTGFDNLAAVPNWLGNFSARSLAELEAVFDAARINKWNCIAADRHGDIGYYYFAAARRRSDAYRWNAPVDGSLAATEWGAPLTWRDLPHTRNPASGYLQNCNNNAFTVTSGNSLRPADFPAHLMSQATTLPADTRAFRATELIEARERHDAASLRAITFDLKALTAEPLRRRILSAADQAGAAAASGPRAAALAALRNWDGNATTDNLALPILAAFNEAAQPAAAPARAKGKAARLAARQQPAADQSPAAVLAALDAALALLAKRFGPGPVTWGQVHVIQRGDRSLPMPGAGSERGMDPFTTLFMTGAKRQVDGKFPCDSGSSWLQFVTYRDGRVTAETILPFGNSNDPASPHYADQMPLYAQRTFKPALLARAEIEAAQTRRTVLTRE